MSLIKIIANSIELDFVRETLSIKTENNALSRDFKVSASNHPFLIIENLNTKKALGTRELSSVKKIKAIEVIVFEGGSKYYGVLQVLSYLDGFRKCNLKYSSVILSIMSTKIADFMPKISVIPGETNPVPFAETTETPVPGSEHWKTYPLAFLNQNFPEVKWQFPTLKWMSKFGVDLDLEDPWYLYNNSINEYDAEGLIENKFTIVSDTCTVENKNVIAPQVFLLSPAFYALQSLGFTISGNFTTSEFIKRLLFYSNKNNLTQTKPLKATENIVLPNLVEFPPSDGINDNFFYNIKKVTANVVGTYVFEYDFDEPQYVLVPGYIDKKMFQVYIYGEPKYSAFTHLPGDPANRFKGTVSIEITTELIGKEIFVRYFTPINTFPPYTISQRIHFNKEYYQMHPTMELGRYLPDWTFGTYLNELQNLFNLEIIPDDFAKTVTFNFNEENILTGAICTIKKSLAVSGYDQTPYNAFLLKYDNEEDPALWITTDATENYTSQKSDLAQTFSSKFKYIPITYTAELSEALDSKNGTGIMIYDPANAPYISSDFLGQTLKMTGNKGIYQFFWKKWLRFLLNSSAVELSGPFTETEINKIIKLKRIFIDHQQYMIATSVFTQTDQDNYKIKFNLVSVTF